MIGPDDPRHTGAWTGFDRGEARQWIPLALKLATLLAGILAAFLGGEHRGEETTFLVAMGRAREAVSDDLESRTFRALEAEAARDGRVPASVVSHLARVISDLELELRDCQMKGNP